MGQFTTILSQFGRDVTWKQRQEDGSYLDMGSIKVIVQPAPKGQTPDPPYGDLELKRVFASSQIKIGDELIFDDQTWEVNSVDHYQNTILGEEYYRAIVKGAQIPA